MNLSINCPINNLGYGCAGINITTSLAKKGVNVSLFPIGNPEAHPRHHSILKQCIENSQEFDPNAPCIKIWHQNDLAMFVGKGRHIGFPIFELDNFTKLEKHHLKSCDHLYVCSHWAQNIIREKVGVDASVIPLGVDNTIFQPKLSKRKPTVFLNMGKWEKRKGHDILIQAFNKVFSNVDNVELWMMCNNPFLTETQQKQWEDLYRGEKVRILPKVETDTQVAEIMQQADCGVFPSRAEGWNLEISEILSCGKQVITTNYSGHTEYCTHENSHLINIRNKCFAYDGIWFHNQGHWADFDGLAMEQLMEYMWKVHQDKQSGNLILNQGGVETSNRFSWDNTAQTIIRKLECT